MFVCRILYEMADPWSAVAWLRDLEGGGWMNARCRCMSGSSDDDAAFEFYGRELKADSVWRNGQTDF